jgi:hypothetical protein
VVARDEDRRADGVGRDEVAGVRDLALVADEQPAPRENALDLAAIDLGVRVDLVVDETVGRDITRDAGTAVISASW